jgi:hypothetical protein
MIKKWPKTINENAHHDYFDEIKTIIIKTRPEEIVFCFEIQAVVHYFLLIVANRRCLFLKFVLCYSFSVL